MTRAVVKTTQTAHSRYSRPSPVMYAPTPFNAAMASQTSGVMVFVMRVVLHGAPAQGSTILKGT